jgi:peptide deformylase
MAILEVLHYPDPRLRRTAAPVTHIDQAVRELARDMLETMYAEHGIGLAATQVGKLQRLVVMDLSEDHSEPRVLVNPEVLSAEGTEEMQEGCLSVPGFYETVQRAERIRYRHMTLDGELREEETDGLLAVCVQHEIDHLNGKLFIDYLSPLKRGRIRKKAEKQEKIAVNAL